MTGKLMGYDDIEITIEKSRLRPLDVSVLQCDYIKAKKFTGWEPKIGIEEGLKRTVDWYMTNGKHWVWEKIIE
jgi:nucleoside-diphosphate-sugar epimerase